MELTYFKSLREACECAIAELNKSLQEDINRLSWLDDATYSEEERQAELNRHNDMRKVLSLMSASPDLLASLQGCIILLEDYYNPAFENGRLDAVRAAIAKAMHNSDLKGPSPVALAKAATPFWFQTIHNYDGLELAPVAEYREEDGSAYCERVCDPQEAQFWSVYGHLPVGGVECLEDYPSEQEAVEFADRLLEIYPNLQIHGLMRA